MRKKTVCFILAILLLALCAGCQKKSKALADGSYHIEVALTGGTG